MTSDKKKFATVALGCRTNQYEAQGFSDQLKALGFERAKSGERADLCIVNTCTVTAGADRSSRHEIRQLARLHPGARIVVTGCFAERSPEVVRSIEGVTDIISNKEKEQLVEKLFPDLETLPEFRIERFEAHTRAFLKIQDGCNSFCTYCIIPYVRGRSRSRSFESIVDEAKALIANGYKEIVLTGINIGDFEAAELRLADLVKEIDALPGLERLRISSIDPDEVDEELLRAVTEGKKTSPSMHIVLQSGSNVVLKRMNRKYTRQMFMETVDRLKAASPEFTFTTDIIVGFPGETEEDFEETLQVMREVRFAKVHMFPYSDRPRTKASTYTNKVAPEVIAERKSRLLCLAEEIAYDLREAEVGKELLVLTESRDEENLKIITGHTANFLPVRIESPFLMPNQLVKVHAYQNSPLGLCATLI